MDKRTIDKKSGKNAYTDAYDESDEEEYYAKPDDKKYRGAEDISRRAVGRLVKDSVATRKAYVYEQEGLNADEGAGSEYAAGDADDMETDVDSMLDSNPDFEDEDIPRTKGKERYIEDSFDTDKTYKEYINITSKVNQMEMEKKKTARDRSIRERDEKLAPPVTRPQRTAPARDSSQSPAYKKAAERTETVPTKRYIEHDEEEYDEEYEEGESAFSFSDIRFIIAAVGAVVLIVFVFLIVQVNSANAKLKAAEKDLTALKLQENVFQGADIKITGLEETIKKMEDDYKDLQAKYDAIKPEVPEGGEGNGLAPQDAPPAQGSNGNVDPPAITTPNSAATGLTTNSAGQQIYVSQKNDTFWTIAAKFYDKGSDYPKILKANNLTEADASKLKEGTTLIIP